MKTALKLFVLGGLIIGYSFLSQHLFYETTTSSTDVALRQFDDATSRLELQRDRGTYNNLYFLGWISIGVIGICFFTEEVMGMFKKTQNVQNLVLIGFVSLTCIGCYRPFEPVKLETIQTNEEAFLLPFTDNVEKQKSTNNEEFLRKNLVYTQQVQIPQQWVPKGYETWGANGEWKDGAILVKVDKAPVTREWTADPNSGTSTKNEAIWVMTSDQVEFSTGWTCTARISSRDDAVKFLHNYPNGTLSKVMDEELRAKIQAEFGLEVTDLPMHELRLKATPHVNNVVTNVKKFFLERGITITNLGITGGFIYKDPSIIKTLVEVFNAEQKKSIAMALAAAQAETNKQIQLEADSKAKALLTAAQGEADGIKLVADAKVYEIEKAKQDATTYIMLKKIELEKAKMEKWDGRFPTTFMGNGEHLNLLFQSPIGETRNVENK